MEYKCGYCEKEYKSSQSKSNHIMLKHKDEHIKFKEEYKNRCSKCDKMLSCPQSKSRHEKKCMENNIKVLEEKNKLLEELLKEMIKNKQSNINNINNGTINNNVNSIIINTQTFGEEDILELLSRKEVLEILNKKLLSLEESVKTVHLNKKHKDCQNIIIKNLNNRYAYVWDGERFVAKLKDDVLEELITNHVNFIETSLETYKDFLSINIQKKITEMLDKLESPNKYVNKQLHKTFKTYRTYKKEELKMLIYNNTKNETTIVVSFDNDDNDDEEDE